MTPQDRQPVSPLSENLVEIAAEIRDPATWAAMQIVKGGRPDMTGEEAFAMIEDVFRHALARTKVDNELRKAAAKYRCLVRSEGPRNETFEAGSDLDRLLGEKGGER